MAVIDDRTGATIHWQEVERAVAERYARLGPGQRRVVDRLLADSRYAAMSAAELAREVGVDQATVTRAAQALGFSGYPDLRLRLRQRLMSAVPDRVQATVADLADTAESAALRAIREDIASLEATAHDLDGAALEGTVRAVIGARVVLVFGSRGSYGLAVMLSLGLRLLRPDVRLLSATAGDLADQLVDIGPPDTVIALGLKRVDRVAVDVLRLAHLVGAVTVAITDHRTNPLARRADHVLIARPAPLRLLPSYASGASLVHALLTVLSLRVPATATRRLESAEMLWEQLATHAEE